MIQLDYKDKRALYQQIKDKIKLLIIQGVLEVDEKLPSVRELASNLTINPNTIQRAYKELEEEGYIYSIRGKGNFVCERKDKSEIKVNALLNDLDKLVKEIKYVGVSRERIERVISKVYEEGRE